MMKKILYVEDEPDDREAFEKQAKQYGYTIILESQGANLIERTELEKPDILLVDWALIRNQVDPDYLKRDGIVLANKARAKWPELPIIVLTSKDFLEEKDSDNAKLVFIKKDADWNYIFRIIDYFSQPSHRK